MRNVLSLAMGLTRRKWRRHCGFIKESIIEKTFLQKSPLTPLFQRGEFLPLAKGGQEGFELPCLYNYGPMSSREAPPNEYPRGNFGVNEHCPFPAGRLQCLWQQQWPQLRW